MENLEHKRHTLAHLLALAVRRDFPHALPTIGPAIDTGFYYDFDFTGGNDRIKKLSVPTTSNEA